MLLAFFDDPDPWVTFERRWRIWGWAAWASLSLACECWPVLTGRAGDPLAHSSPVGFLRVAFLQTLNFSFAVAQNRFPFLRL